MGKIYFSASMGGFCLEDDKPEFVAGIGWPADAKEISQRWYEHLLTGQTAGKHITPNEYGYPVLMVPEVDYVGSAKTEKSQRLAEATAEITPLQDAVDLSIATDEEISQMNVWKTYRVEVYRVDTTAAPNIKWPVPPTF